jgi:hypothetical protein
MTNTIPEKQPNNPTLTQLGDKINIATPLAQSPGK